MAGRSTTRPRFLVLWAIIATFVVGFLPWIHVARAQSGSAAGSAASAPTVPPTVPPPIASNATPASKRSADPPGPLPIPKGLPEKPRFIVVELHEEVNLGMAAFIERIANELREGDILVLDIKTFGGRLDAAVTIRDALLHTHDVGARTVAYINPRAISAGALIAYAADVIVVAKGATMGAATPVQLGEDQEMKPVSEKVVSYMRQEMRATAEARGRNGDIAEAMVDTDIEIDGLIDKGKLLTLDGKQALAWGVANFEADSFDALVEGLGHDAANIEVERRTLSWAEKVSGFLSNPVIASLLMSVGMLALMIGLYTGGNATALTIGGVCLAVFFFGHHVVNLAGVEDILLFVIGLALIAYEAYAPGHIIPGVLGVLCVIGSLVMGLIDFGSVDLSVQWAAGYISTALTTVSAAILLTAVSGAAAFHVLPRSPLGPRLILARAINARASDGRNTSTEGTDLIGAHGVALTNLHPSGKVRVDGKRRDAKAEHGFIEAGTAVVVIGSAGFELIVAELKNDEETSA